LNATSDPSALQAKVMASLFDMDTVSLTLNRLSVVENQLSRCRATRQHRSGVKPNSLIFTNAAF
jgi:hypothetical protein